MRAGSEADEATRGSAVKLAAEVASRLLGLATTYLLLRGLGAAEFGRFGLLSVCALLLAESGELGLQALASRALVAGTASLRSFVRARLLCTALVLAVALAVAPGAPALAGLATRAAREIGSRQDLRLDGVPLALLIAWFALSGWGEFLGVALRCRGARAREALLLLTLRAAGLAFAAAALVAGGGLLGVCAALAASPVPAIALGAVLLLRTPAPAPAPSVAPGAVLRQSAPLAVHGVLLLLSPRVEFLVLSWLGSGRAEAGLFYAALNVVWFLSMVPTAIAAGAMPALTREALQGDASVRRRSAGTLALFAAPAAVGLALVAPALARLLLGAGYEQAEYSVSAGSLAVMAAAVPAMFLNALAAASLIAAGRSAWLPWLTAARVALAFALAFLLVPRFGAAGASAGLVCAEWGLLLAGRAACRRASFPLPVARPLVYALLACIPMALAVVNVREALPLALPMGVLTWVATLLAASRLLPARVRRLTGDLRYPWVP
jgi:O-antigen/teichoic acid export membrane protein